MTTQELKQYINDKLGNGLRCLLPSYWWKRLLGLVVDKIDDAIPNVTSEEKLNGLDSKIGSLATVSYKNNAVISPSQCYQITEAELESIENNGTAHGIDLTTIYGVEFPSVIPSVEKNLLFYFFKDGVLLEGNIVIQNSVGVCYYDATGEYVLYDDSGFLINEAVEYINALFKDGVQYGCCMAVIDGSGGLYSDYDTIDKVVKFIVENSASDAYIKNQYGWDKLAKEKEDEDKKETEIPTIFYSFVGSIIGIRSKVDYTYDLWESTKEILINDASFPDDIVGKAQAIFDESIAANRKLFLDFKNGKKSSGIVYVNDNRLILTIVSGKDSSLSDYDYNYHSVAKVVCLRNGELCEVYFTTMLNNVQDGSMLNGVPQQSYVFQLMETGEVKVLYDIPLYFIKKVTNDTQRKHNITFVNCWYEAQMGDLDIVGNLPFERIYINGYPDIKVLSTEFTSEKFTGTYFDGEVLKEITIDGTTGIPTIRDIGQITPKLIFPATWDFNSYDFTLENIETLRTENESKYPGITQKYIDTIAYNKKTIDLIYNNNASSVSIETSPFASYMQEGLRNLSFLSTVQVSETQIYLFLTSNNALTKFANFKLFLYLTGEMEGDIFQKAIYLPSENVALNVDRKENNKRFVKEYYSWMSASEVIMPSEICVYQNGKYPVLLTAEYTTSDSYKIFKGTYMEGASLMRVEISEEDGEAIITTLGTFATVTE